MKPGVKYLLIFLAVITLILLLLLIKNKVMPKDFKYFNYSEFDSPDAPGSGKDHMKESFIHMLDDARERAGIPFYISSGYRTASHNQQVGGEPNSSHMIGYAADISAPIAAMRKAIIKAAVAAGFKRIGEGSNFVHLDTDPNKPQYAYWQYGNQPSFNNPWA